MVKFKGKYRIESNRLKGWDYSSEAMYFITIVTQNRECNLGKIVNGKMILSDFGKIIKTEWLESFDIRHELFLDEYVIMPNHLHAIVIIKNRITEFDADVDNGNVDNGNVETHGRASLPIIPIPSPSFQLYRLPSSA